MLAPATRTNRPFKIQEFDRALFPSRYSEVAQNPRRDPRDLVPRQWQTALRVVASWHGLSQQSPRGATGAVAETCARWPFASLFQGVYPFFPLRPGVFPSRSIFPPLYIQRTLSHF